MNRLTVKTAVYENGAYNTVAVVACGVEFKDVVDRLAAYEDTWLEPEEVEQIRRAAEHMMFESASQFVRYASNNFDELQKYKALGDYNRLRELAQANREGLYMVLPCKIGDFVYLIKRKLDGSDCVQKAEFWWSDIPEIGKTVFLTREEAEAALRREQE